MIVIPIVIILLAAVYLFLIFPAKPKKEDNLIFAKRSYAHRGFHDNKKGPSENTLGAFILASKYNYGIELDVQLTKDKEVVVFHDSDLIRTSNIDRKILDIPYEELKGIKVFDRESIPLFSEVLDNVADNIPIIVEIKSEGNRAWVDETCRLTYEILKEHKGTYCIESFDPFAVGWFKKNASEMVRGQLSMGRKKYEGTIKPLTAFLLHNMLLNFISRPHFIAYDHENKSLSMNISKLFSCMMVKWTVKSQVRHDELQNSVDGIIFEGYIPKATW